MDIEPGNCIRNLGAWFDSMLSMETHINKVCSSAFYYLHNLRRIRKYLSQDCLVTLIHAFVTGQLAITIVSCTASCSVRFQNYREYGMLLLALLLTLVNSAI